LKPFRYLRATSEEQAMASVDGRDKAAFVAGGTSIVDLMKLDVETPPLLVDISRLPLDSIEPIPGQDPGVRIGAMVRNSVAAEDPLVRSRYPLVSEALRSGASNQLRNMATIGGNLLQRVRCYYFRDTSFACNKRSPGSGCSAMESLNRTHAILGTSDSCIATHPSDLCVALVALDAVIATRGPDGDERSVPIGEFYRLPEATPHIENILRPAELITAVELRAPVFPRSHYLKIRDRASFDFALVSVGVALSLREETISEVRIGLGGVGTVPWRAVEAERALKGSAATEPEFRAAAEIALQDARPRRDNGFKVELAKRAMVRALTTTVSSSSSPYASSSPPSGDGTSS
jgi:xanthine dehydrogenase YagS FAD-binding subunit